MKTFENENYYRILQVPTNASADEIKHAYREALALYAEESVVTYSLFSEEQRKNLLRAIQTAFDTLVNEDKRAAYNQMLIDTGQVEAAVLSGRTRREPAVYSDTQSTSREKSLSQWVQKKAGAPEIKQLIEAILSREQLSGLELKQLREAYGIEIPEIYAITRISADTLKSIEANQYENLPAAIYVKHFLKAYAEILQIDPRHVVESYLKSMARDKSNH
jgi:curved DNA-binding protein CbpA